MRTQFFVATVLFIALLNVVPISRAADTGTWEGRFYCQRYPQLAKLQFFSASSGRFFFRPSYNSNGPTGSYEFRVDYGKLITIVPIMPAPSGIGTLLLSGSSNHLKGSLTGSCRGTIDIVRTSNFADGGSCNPAVQSVYDEGRARLYGDGAPVDLDRAIELFSKAKRIQEQTGNYCLNEQIKWNLNQAWAERPTPGDNGSSGQCPIECKWERNGSDIEKVCRRKCF